MCQAYNRTEDAAILSWQKEWVQESGLVVLSNGCTGCVVFKTYIISIKHFLHGKREVIVCEILNSI